VICVRTPALNVSRNARTAVPAVVSLLLVSVLFGTYGAGAADFRSVAENAAVLYDAPSAKAKKLYVVNYGYPFELVVVVEGWSKVRDASGEMTWIESKLLSEKRTVMVRQPLVPVREAADDNAPVAFQAQQNVLLELLEVAGGGWLKVRHRDGPSGFIRVSQVWGA
jgi:SH3-like domain-containing protein